jgi:type IV pilus assembly protein PilQ
MAACAALAGSLMVSAETAPIRLIGVSVEGSTVLIEATDPAPYAVAQPDPLTVYVDLRNVTAVATAVARVKRTPAIADVQVEQRKAVDGLAVARVHVSLARPADYKVRSTRNTIRLDLAPTAASVARHDVPAPPATMKSVAAPAATVLERVRTQVGAGTTITLSGNGRLTPSTVVEAQDLPRRLVLDFPNVSSRAPAQTPVEGGLVRKVRVGTNSNSPLVTRVVMEIADGVRYKVDRSGDSGRDVAVVFEPHKAEAAAASVEPEPAITLRQAIANAAAITPPADVPPVEAMDALKTVRPAPQAPAAARTAATSPPAPVVAPVPPPPSAPVSSFRPETVATRPQPAARRDVPAQTPPPVPAAPPSPPTPPPAAPQPQTPPQTPPPTPPPSVQTPASSPAPPTAPASGQQGPATQEIGPTQPPRRFTGHPVSMDFQGVDLRSVLRTFAEISGLNMVIDPDVQGTVDIVLTDVPWDQALDVILRGNSLDYTVDGTIVRIARIDTLKKEQEARRELARAAADAGSLVVRTFSLSYAKAAATAPLVTRAVLSQRGTVMVDERTNTLIITDLASRLDTVSDLLATLDRPEPQVEIEARIITTTREFARTIGVQWGLNGRMTPELGNTTGLAFPNRGTLGGRLGTQGPGGSDPRAGELEQAGTVVNLGATAASAAIGLALGSVNGAFNLDVALSALERTGKGRILSTPRVTTQNNVEAEITQGVQIPVQTEANNTITVSFKDAALTLKVTPQITAANTVIMQITLENATPGTPVLGIPSIDTQRAITRVQVSDGMTTVMGGIFVSREQGTIDRVPVLHRIPLLGWLFKRDDTQDESRELLIFITPRILKG